MSVAVDPTSAALRALPKVQEPSAIAPANARVQEAPTPFFLELCDAADWHDADVPSRRWILQEWLPVGEAALWTGAGAVGKSLSTQQLSICVAAGVPFLGIELTQAPTVYITCEDSKEELQRRFKAITSQLGIRLISRAVHDTELEGGAWP